MKRPERSDPDWSAGDPDWSAGDPPAMSAVREKCVVI